MKHKPPPSAGPRRHVPTSAIASFIEPAAIDAILVPWVPDAEARQFVVRCILAEGPAHHRGANYVLLVLLGRVLELVGGKPTMPDDEDGIGVPIRLPPQLVAQHDDADYPLRFPRRVVEQLAPRDAAVQAAMIDCLTDGPPQHALANAAMLCVLDALLHRGKEGAP